MEIGFLSQNYTRGHANERISRESPQSMQFEFHFVQDGESGGWLNYGADLDIIWFGGMHGLLGSVFRLELILLN